MEENVAGERFEALTRWPSIRWSGVMRTDILEGREPDPNPGCPAAPLVSSLPAMLSLLWQRIEQRLDEGLPRWQNDIDHLGQVTAVKKREGGSQWSDDEIFEGLVRSILSANTNWSKVESVLPALCTLFHGFSVLWYATLTPADVKQKLVPWFKQRKAGSAALGPNLLRLIESAKQLKGFRVRDGSLENYLAQLSSQHNGDPKAMAAALGEERSPAKLPCLRVPLAAEFLKNVGYDVSKPDRHINRAVGSFGLVQFANWPDRDGFKTPQAGKYELRTVMDVMERWALKLSVRATFLDNAVWLLCSSGRLHLSNSDLAALRLTSCSSGRWGAYRASRRKDG
jgi:hypothetical protein